MRAQRPAHLAPAIDAVAASLPFDDAAFDAAMAILTVHHWPDPTAGLRELRRVARHAVVILTFDGPALEQFWLNDYAPELIAVERRRYPPIDFICDVLGGTCGVGVVEIACDCTDGFGDALYARPEQFLDPAVRKAQSGWGFVAADSESRSVERLRADLDSGEWDRRYGHLRSQRSYRGAVRLITATPSA
jgi:SAM-dependent methyltransferase